MSDRIPAGAVTDAAALGLAHEPVPADQVVAGMPTTALRELDETTGAWEMSPGAMSDIEADELFIVLSGDATVAFTDPALPSVELRAGSVMRLEAGMHTVWTVHQTLRKVYITL